MQSQQMKLLLMIGRSPGFSFTKLEQHIELVNNYEISNLSQVQKYYIIQLYCNTNFLEFTDAANVRQTVFLVPMNGGIWTLCIDLQPEDMKLLKKLKIFPQSTVTCINYLSDTDSNIIVLEELKSEWQPIEMQATLQPHLSM